MLSLAPLFSLCWRGYEELCVCGELAVAGADGASRRSGEGRARAPVRSLLEPFVLAATDASTEPASAAGGPRLSLEALRQRAAEPELQARLAAWLGVWLGRGSPVEILLDDDARPLPLLEPSELAVLYRELASAAEDTPLGNVRRALLAQPAWLDGGQGVGARLMQANPGRVIAASSADGGLALGVAPTPGAALGTGIALRLAGGGPPAWAALAVQPFLEALGLVPLPSTAREREVRWHVRPARWRPVPIDISPALSERLAVWPGDVPFRRTASVEPGPAAADAGAPSWQVRVSSIHTTLHAGAHVDAPNHVGAGGPGIDGVPLEPYRGLCEVVRVQVPRRSALTPRDLGGRTPQAPRVLFATGSYPDPERFDPDFSALSPELVTWLEAHGVVLVGIDTPSVDPLAAEDLPSHRATRLGRGLAILEGLVLDGVEPGLYELLALPLRIAGADASPVRASLWPLR